MKTAQNYTCTLDADGWQAYSDMKGAPAAARKLSAALTKRVREAKQRLKADDCLSENKLAAKVRDEMYKLMGNYSSLGFGDTEPQCVLVNELERAFGLDRYSLDR